MPPLNERTRLEAEAGRAALAKRTVAPKAPTKIPEQEAKPQTTYSVEMLSEMAFDELRELGHTLGVKGRSRHELVSEIGAALGIMPKESTSKPTDDEIADLFG